MKRHSIGTQTRRAMAALVAMLPLTAATAFDGIAPGFSPHGDAAAEHALVNFQDAGSAYVGDSYLPPNDYQDSAHCNTCEAPTSHCGCGLDDPRGIFARKQARQHRHHGPLAPWWAHRTTVFGEFLWLRPGSTDVIYATEQTDPDPLVASPTGPLGIVGLDGEPGYRVGGSVGLSLGSSLNLAYARWDGSSRSAIGASGGNVLSSNVIHPSTLTSGAASLEATALHDMNFQTLDLNYRHLWKKTDVIAVNWLAGVRYGNIEQQFQADQTVAVASGLTHVTTDIDFEGFGISGGLDFETYSCTTGLMLYGKTMASLMAGEWKASYDQRNQFGGGVISNRYEDFHATPTLDAELGVRWMGPQRHLVLSSGFLMSAWYESLTTRSYIDSVRDGRLTDAGETMTFSGLTARAEWRF
ncbi:MAG: Lpg1974 family pore-forming outer membrane protein [Novipirellula sp. JB048]